MWSRLCELSYNPPLHPICSEQSPPQDYTGGDAQALLSGLGLAGVKAVLDAQAPASPF